jgi:anti-sigma-K factor RskA
MIHSPRLLHLTCAQFVDMAEAFALDALDEHEQRACARHAVRAVHHADCREALTAARGVVDRLAAALPGGAPPPRLWSAIESRLGIDTGSSNAEWL